MVELALTRSSDDRRRFELAGLGSVRKLGLFTSATEITTRDGVLRTERHGVFRPVVQALDEAGTVVGEFQSYPVRSGGDVSWRGEPLELSSESWWGNRYLLARSGQPVLRLHCSGWGGRIPVRVSFEGPEPEAGLMLFVTSVVQMIVAEGSSSSGAGAG